MSGAEKLYHHSAQSLQAVEPSKMFGKLCLKSEGKAFVAFFENQMVFKLTGLDHGQALKLKGAKLFDPSGKGRPMKEWVQVPYIHHQEWQNLAEQAHHYLLSQIK